jgi:hypothetical protein
MDVNCWAQFGQAAGPFLTCIVGGLTLYVLHRQTELMQDLKKADSLLEFGRRYDTLLEQQGRIAPKDRDAETESYYCRFFELQFHEFRAWQKGHLDDDIYEDWLVSRRLNVFQESYANGWISAKKMYIGNADFVVFMNEIHDCEIANVRPEIQRIMDEHKRSRCAP